jgi:hypothetical protein
MTKSKMEKIKPGLNTLSNGRVSSCSADTAINEQIQWTNYGVKIILHLLNSASPRSIVNKINLYAVQIIYVVLTKVCDLIVYWQVVVVVNIGRVCNSNDNKWLVGLLNELANGKLKCLNHTARTVKISGVLNSAFILPLAIAGVAKCISSSAVTAIQRELWKYRTNTAVLLIWLTL